jgi:hypothetical protein
MKKKSEGVRGGEIIKQNKEIWLSLESKLVVRRQSAGGERLWEVLSTSAQLACRRSSYYSVHEMKAHWAGRICLSAACFNSRTAGRILMAFFMQIVPFEATPNSYFLCWI